MISAEDARAFALSLPETREGSHFDQPDFRLRNHIFATLPGDGRAWIKISRIEMEAVVQSDPETFEGKAWGASSWLGVELARVDADEFRELVTEAWRSIAPKKLLAGFDAGPS
jgi:hypothetical protein